jgi:hypothetical protein
MVVVVVVVVLVVPSPWDCRTKVHKLGQSGQQAGPEAFPLEGACGKNAGFNAVPHS